jgi:hypothetical protein
MNHREMARLAADPTAVRMTATFVATALADKLSGAEQEFLTRLSKFDGPDPLSMRQREWLDALRSRATRRSKVKGYQASTLVKKLWELRSDLAEEAEEFVTELYELQKEQGANLALSNAQWRYVFALCHEIGEVERYVAFE